MLKRYRTDSVWESEQDSWLTPLKRSNQCHSAGCATPADHGGDERYGDYPYSRPAKAARADPLHCVNVVLLLLTCGLLLYVFMLSVDLDEIKRRLSKEVEIRQQAERYLVEARNQLTDSQRESNNSRRS